MCRPTDKTNSTTFRDEPEVQFLYKYCALNERNFQYMERIFTHNELRFPSPREFNDPFDSKIQLCLDGTKEEWKRYLRELYKKFQPNLNRKQRDAEVEKILKEKRPYFDVVTLF